MRVIFAGTPEFARVALEQLQSAGHEIALVLTQPDRPAGRGMKLQASPVKQWAQSQNIPVAQPSSLRLDGKYPQDAQDAQAAIAATQADVMVVAAYGLILPPWALMLPRLGCLNIHASLLPRWRGAAPIHRAIQAGDAQTGVTIMQMDAGLDTGDMLLMEAIPIVHSAPDPDSTATLHDKLAVLGGRLIVQALALAEAGILEPVKQPIVGINYAFKIEKAEAAVDWSQPVTVIDQHLRAMTPFPGATAQLATETLKLWRAHIASCSRPSGAMCGQILAADPDGVQIACADGVLIVTELQRAGGKRLVVGDFLRGFPLEVGQSFDLHHP